MIGKLASIAKRAFAAVVNFWNIPPLGPEESDETRRLPLPRL